MTTFDHSNVTARFDRFQKTLAKFDLARMKVKQLADELEWRGAPKSGRKRVQQLRLRALMIIAAQ